MKFLLSFFLLSFSWIQLCLAISTTIPAPSPEAQKILNEVPLLTEPYNLATNPSLLDYNSYYQVRQTTVDSLPGGNLAEIIPILDDPSGQVVIELRITKTAAMNPATVLETMTRFQQVVKSEHGLAGPYQWIETLHNAEAGSLPSRERLARLEIDGTLMSRGYITNYPFDEAVKLDHPKILEYVNLRGTEADARYAPVKKASDADLRARAKAQEAMRPTFDALEKEKVKFDDLILRNDRQGVRRMLETYLPWKQMELTEARAWREWLDAMVSPDPSRMQIVFRGMDDYPTLKGDAGERGIVSSVLAKNQGNYTRRLRSLTTLRDRIGSGTYRPDYNDYSAKPKTGNASILKAMHGHAGNPQGSPFISISDNSTATNFGSRERVALKVDERRLVPNLMAFGYSEKERLIPLVIFPDEIVTSIEAPVGSYIDETAWKTQVETAIGRPLTAQELTWDIDSEAYKKWAFERTREQFLTPPPTSIVGANCAADSAEVLKKLLNE